MNCSHKHLLLFLAFLWFAACGTARVASPDAELAVDPARRVHGHNDYLQPVPLRRALELGLGSVEADVFLQDGELRVGHELWQLRPGRTLASLYLEPLAQFVRAEPARFAADGPAFVLLVDIKTDGAAVYARLREELAAHRSMLTRFVAGSVQRGPVTVLLSGDRPRALLAADDDRLCALDGRLVDLEQGAPAHLMPWISDRWSRIGDWTGSDELMREERARIVELVARADARGQELRFWGAPDRAEAWRAFYELGVHRIGSDRPHKAVAALREQGDGR